MNLQKSGSNSKYCTVTAKSCTSSGSSDYSTCSDNVVENENFKRENLHMSVQSVIIAGQVLRDYQQVSDVSLEELVCHLPNKDLNNETNYSVNLLDQNLDILTDNEDFVDCENSSKSDTNADNSTKYMQTEVMLKLSKLKSSNHFYNSYLNLNNLKENVDITSSRSNNSSPSTAKMQTEHERLRTILEETHVTNSLVKKPSPVVNQNSTGALIVEMVEQVKRYENDNDYNKNSTKRVLFANENNMDDDNQECRRNDKSRLRKRQQTPKSLVGKDECYAQKERDIGENCNNHNTTESFVLWEKFCKTSENLICRRSFSFSELNSVTESYGGDDEYSSTSFKTIDDTYISHFSHKALSNEDSPQKRRFRCRSKSCDSLLKEVKHLPHILYDRFLKSLAKEIENIRKQNVICTCQKSSQKQSNEEKKGRNLKHRAVKATVKTVNESNDKKEAKHVLKVSPLKTVTNQIRLSPEILKNSSQNIQRLSPRSPNKTPTTPSKLRGLYSWNKEIVSPVGEYIRGKRQSPFQSSPNKKKV